MTYSKSFHAVLDENTLPLTGGNWIKATHEAIDGLVCEGMSLAQLIESKGFKVTTFKDTDSVAFTE